MDKLTNDMNALQNNEYTQKAIDLYAKLKIDISQSLSLEQLAEEYAQCQKSLTRENVVCSNCFLSR